MDFFGEPSSSEELSLDDSLSNKKRSHTPNISRACDSCKINHKKCDGGQPSCNECVRKNALCCYTLKQKKRGPKSLKVEGRSHTNCTCSDDLQKHKAVAQFWRLKYLQLQENVNSLVAPNDNVPLSLPFSTQQEKITFMLGRDTFHKCMHVFDRFVLPLCPSFRFESNKSAEYWEELSVPMSLYKGVLRLKSSKALIEELKQSSVFASGTLLAGCSVETWQDFSAKTAEIMEALFTRDDDLDHLSLEDAEDVVVILMLMSEHFGCIGEYVLKEKCAKNAIKIHQKKGGSISAIAFHSICVQMISCATTVTERDYWARQALQITQRTLANQLRMIICITVSALRPELNGGFWWNKPEFNPTVQQELERALYTTEKMMESVDDSNLHEDVLLSIRVCLFGVKAILLAGDYPIAALPWAEKAVNLCSMIKEFRFGYLPLGIMLVMQIFVFCKKKEQLRQGLYYLRRCSEVVPKARKIAEIVEGIDQVRELLGMPPIPPPEEQRPDEGLLTLLDDLLGTDVTAFSGAHVEPVTESETFPWTVDSVELSEWTAANLTEPTSFTNFEETFLPSEGYTL